MKFQLIRSLLVASSALLATTFASAASYTFEYLSTNSTYTVVGSLTTSDVLNGVNGYEIVGISGTVSGPNGGAITALVPNPAAPGSSNTPGINGWYIIFDNNLFPTSTPLLNSFGVAFYTSGGATWNLFSNANNYSLFSNSIPGNIQNQGTFTVTAVPEPETYAMMLAGLGLIGTIARRRKSKQG